MMKTWFGGFCVAVVLGLAVCVAGAAEIVFEKTTLDPLFRAEGVAVGDFNGDGRKDIAAGSVYYAAPDWKMVPICEKPKAFLPKQYSDAFCWLVQQCLGGVLAASVLRTAGRVEPGYALLGRAGAGHHC